MVGGGEEDVAGVVATTTSIDDDLELVFDKLELNLNRTNSNASCNSTNSLLIDSGYISSNDLLDSSSCNQATVSASRTTPPLSSSSLSSSSFSPPSSASVSTYTLLQDSSHQAPSQLPVQSQKRLSVKAGYYGKAKTSSLDEPTMLLLTMLKETPSIENDRVNLLAYGDDVGLLLSKSDSEQYYFAVADGVSANRARGYDPSLFPNALLTACGHYLLSHESCQLDLTTTSKDEQTSEDVKTTPYVQLSSESNESQQGEQEEEFYDEYDEELNDAEEIYEEYDDFNDTDDDNQFDIGTNLLEDEQEETDLLDEVFDASEERETRFLFEALKSAHETVEDQKVYGSSTVCLLSLKPDTSGAVTSSASYLLSTCNLGDSGYMIMRDRRVIYKSATQSHRYNAPYQIGCTPPELLDHDLYRDNPDDSVRTNHRVRPGDLLIISSDGLFDNLYEDEIAMVISNHLSSSCSDHDSGATNKTVKNVTNEMLSSACELLVRRASTGNIYSNSN